MTWTELVPFAASLATIAASIAIMATVIIYYSQLRAMTKARQLESLLVIMRYADDLQLRQARYLILEHGDEFRRLFEVPFSFDARRAIDAKIRELSSGHLELHNIDLSVNALNNIGYLIRNDYAPIESAGGFLRNTLLRGWEAFEPYIKFCRSRPDKNRGASRYAEQLEWVIINKC